MTVSIPIVTALYAALLGLLAAALTVRVILQRVKTGVQAGDGGNADLAQAIRAHANLVEQAPLALLLIALAEATGSPAVAIHGLGAALVIARLANAWGLSHSLGPTMPRQSGAGLTVLVVVSTSVLTLYRLRIARWSARWSAGPPGRAPRLRASFLAAQALRDEGKHQGVEGNALSSCTRGQLRVDRLGYPGNEPSRGDATAVRRGNGQLLGFQRGDRRLQCALAIRQRFFHGLAVGDAVRKVGVRNKKTTPFFLAQRANCERVVSKFGHGQAPSTSSRNILR